MDQKTSTAKKDPSVVALPWLDPAWAETADRFGDRFADTLSAASRDYLGYMETIAESQLAFLRHRLHADFECAKTLTDCRDVGEAARVTTAFWEVLFTDYSKAAEKAGEDLRTYMSEAWTTTTAVTETAMEAANSAEEAITKLASKTAA